MICLQCCVTCRRRQFVDGTKGPDADQRSWRRAFRPHTYRGDIYALAGLELTTMAGKCRALYRLVFVVNTLH